MIEKVYSSICNSNVSSYAAVQNGKDIFHSFSLSSLHGKKSFTNPITVIWNWFTNCLKTFWGFICRICCCKKASVVETKIEKKEGSSSQIQNSSYTKMETEAKQQKEEKKVVVKEESLAQVNHSPTSKAETERTKLVNSIIRVSNSLKRFDYIKRCIDSLELPKIYDKTIIHVRYGEEIYKDVFIERERESILSKVKLWINGQKPDSNAMNFSVNTYSFYDKGWFNPIDRLLVCTNQIDWNNLRRYECAVHIDRPSFIKNIENNDALLNIALPQLLKHPIPNSLLHRLQKQPGFYFNRDESISVAYKISHHDIIR